MELFTIADRFDNYITLTAERWNHTLKHEVPGINAVKQCVQKPVEVRESQYKPQTHLYYRQLEDSDDDYICVVVDVEKGFIITAYTTSDKKEGSSVWTLNE